MAELDTCADYVAQRQQKMLQDHEKKDDGVFRFFKEILEDALSVFTQNDKDREVVATRVQMIALFSVIDIFASYWFEYQNRTGTQSERFETWIDTYCFTEDNEEYTDSVYVNIDSKQLSALRNSMVHFFGLASPKGAREIFCLSTNDRIWDETSDRFVKYQKNKGTTVTVIKSKDFHNLILEGATIMLNEWKTLVQNAQDDERKKIAHVEGIDRIYQKIENEGAFKISVPEEKTSESA